MPFILDVDPDGEILASHRSGSRKGVRPVDYLVPLAGTDFQAPRRFALRYRPVGDEPEWRMLIEIRDGVPICISVAVDATEAGRGVRSGDLRLSVEDYLELATENVSSRLAGPAYQQRIDDLRTGAARRAIRTSRQSARRKVTDDVLRGVARIYRENLDNNPTEAVRAHLGVADRTARLYVRRAREAGHLGPALRGKAGEA